MIPHSLFIQTSGLITCSEQCSNKNMYCWYYDSYIIRRFSVLWPIVFVKLCLSNRIFWNIGTFLIEIHVPLFQDITWRVRYLIHIFWNHIYFQEQIGTSNDTNADWVFINLTRQLISFCFTPNFFSGIYKPIKAPHSISHDISLHKSGIFLLWVYTLWE